MRFNITSKINFLIISIVLVTSISFNIIFRFEYVKRERSNIEDHVMQISRIRSAHFIEHLRDNQLKDLYHEIATDISALNDIINIKIYNRDGGLIVDRNGVKMRPPLDNKVRKQFESKSMVHQWIGDTFRHVEPIRDGGSIIGFIVFEYDASSLARSIRDLETFFVLMTGILTVVFILIGIAFSETLNQPLTALARASRRIAGGDYSATVEVKSRDELGVLADNFNLMVEKLNIEITDRKRAEELVQNILQSIDEGFVVMDREFRIITANRAYCEQVKSPLEEITGRHCYEISHHLHKPCFEEGITCSVRHAFETGEPQTAVHVHQNSEGDPVYIEAKSYPMRDASGAVESVIEILIDITEKKKLEDQLRHAQKMESIGTLAGGIAHDFNNILTAIIGCGKLLHMKADKAGPQIPYIEQIIAAAAKASNLTRGLLTFSRKQVIDPRPLHVNGIVRRVEKLLTRLIGEDIELRVALSDKDLVILADSMQIEQVLMNLATNARDAMPEGGTLFISTERTELNSKFVKTHGYGKPGHYALISVADTGLGMEQKTTERVFEPFFTTKETGKGTGIGLSIVYGIIKQHNGYINVQSTVGTGTIFKIYFPVSTEPDVKEVNVATDTRASGGSEMILVAEDQEEARRAMKYVLEEFGYRVIEAVDGEEAVSKFLENKEKVQLLLFDLALPKKSGQEAYREIKMVKPDITAVFTSGYTLDFVQRKGMLETGFTFIPKPVIPEILLKEVREALDIRRSS